MWVSRGTLEIGVICVLFFVVVPFFIVRMLLTTGEPMNIVATLAGVGIWCALIYMPVRNTIREIREEEREKYTEIA